MIPKTIAFFFACCLLSYVCLAADKPAVTDDTIIDHVMIKFSQDMIVKGGDMKVDCKDGKVTITGTAINAKQRDRASKVAAKVKGVKSVDNQLIIQERPAGK